MNHPLQRTVCPNANALPAPTHGPQFTIMSHPQSNIEKIISEQGTGQEDGQNVSKEPKRTTWRTTPTGLLHPDDRGHAGSAENKHAGSQGRVPAGGRPPQNNKHA
eukprot:6180478-Pleurochrysis_carterae.AAC.2